MESILPQYDLSGATWFYLSLLLIMAIYFRFTRFWSLRNLDLVLLLCMSPALLLVSVRPEVGYAVLFAFSGLLLLRLFCDNYFNRRPRTEQNLNMPGMAFLGIAAFAFLSVLAITHRPEDDTMETLHRADQLIHLRKEKGDGIDRAPGPASPLLAAPVLPVSNVVASQDGRPDDDRGIALIAARILAITAHVAVVLGLFMFGWKHMGDRQLGLAMATLYLLLPCTAYEVHEVFHVLPAALVLWALVFFRRPLVAGSLMGFACGTLFFPVFLLPLWAAFYGWRGAIRFAGALAVVGALLLASLAVTAPDASTFRQQTIGSIDWQWLEFHAGRESGFWTTHDPVYRIPVFAAFVIVLVVLTIWPRKKNLEHLTAHSTAIIVSTQFWYPQQGGIYLLWYLPLMLVVVFRPRLPQLIPPVVGPPEVKSKEHRPTGRRELTTVRSIGFGR